LKKKIKNAISFITPLLLVIVIWETVVRFGLVSERILPPFSSIVLTSFNLLTSDYLLLKHLFVSFYRLSIGYFLGITIGVSVGILLGSREILYRLVMPIISFLVSIPTIAWVPLFLIFIGIGDTTVILAIFLASFFPIVYNTMNGIRSIDKRFIWASKIMGADNLSIFSKVLLPGSLVSIITGLRLGLGYSWRALVGAEMLAATKFGLGFMIYAAKAFYDVKTMFVGLILIALGGLILDHLFMNTLEKHTIKKWGIVRGEVL